MSAIRVRDLLWIWGMKVNALQDTIEYAKLPFERSYVTTEQIIAETGITNVYVAGGLDLTRETLDSMPSATRLVCKTSFHRSGGVKFVKDTEGTKKILRDVKKLAAADRRIDAFALDDFSTGSLEAGVTESDLAGLCFDNAAGFPSMPLHGTIYPMSLEEKALPGMLKYFDQLLLPIWFTDHVDMTDEYVERLNELSGFKPIIYTLYVYDFGEEKPVSRMVMQKQLDIAERLLHDGKIAGCMLLGTCMFDLGWEATDCMYEWIKRTGDDKVVI